MQQHAKGRSRMERLATAAARGALALGLGAAVGVPAATAQATTPAPVPPPDTTTLQQAPQQLPPPSVVPTPSPALPPARVAQPAAQQPGPQQVPSPSPALPPNLPLPALSPVPNQRTVPAGPATPQVPTVSPLDQHITPPDAPAAQITQAERTNVHSERDDVHGLRFDTLGFLGPYRRPTVPRLFPGDEGRLTRLIRGDKLYISLQDALALALENNLDVETERYDITLARTDVTRAAGGGSIRGIDFSIAEPPTGVGGPGSPLLNTETVNANPTTPTVTDLTSLNSTAQAQTNLNQLGIGFTYSTGPSVPLFDPQLIGTAGYFRRENTVTLGNIADGTGTGTTGTGGTGTAVGGGTVTNPQPLNFVALNLGYLQGFSTGAQLEAIVNNDSRVVYGSNGQLDPFSTPSTSVTLTQPLLRGRGTAVNRRYIRLAQTNQRISRLLFEQQVLETVYGISRLYFDLVSLGENVSVKEESLRAATKQRQDDQDQVTEGTLAPIELTRAQALESSSRFDLTQAQGLYKQEEIILRNQLLRTASPAFTAQFDEIVPTDKITVPPVLEPLDLPTLVRQGLSHRPDLAQAEQQIESGKIQAAASRNNMLPQLNVYANVETRGSSEQPYEQLGSTGTGLPTVPQQLALGGLRVSTVYQAGVQVTLPLRNRVAAADAARDLVQVRQVQSRTEKLAQGVRQDVETAVVALQTADAAYRAASNSRNYQEQLLDAERDKLSVGQSTDLAVLQDEAYLAQARSTEIAARSNFMKARIELDHAVGDLLEKNHISLDDAIRGKLPE